MDALLDTASTPYADPAHPRWLAAMEQRVTALAFASPNAAGWLLLHADFCVALSDALPADATLAPLLRTAAERARNQVAASRLRILQHPTEASTALPVLAEPVTMGELVRLLAIAGTSNHAAVSVAAALEMRGWRLDESADKPVQLPLLARALCDIPDAVLRAASHAVDAYQQIATPHGALLREALALRHRMPVEAQT